MTYATQAAIMAWAQPAGGAAAPAGAGGGGEGVPGQQVPASGKGPMGACAGEGGMTSILLMLAMFVVFYFLLIRPQQKKAKEHQRMLEAIQKGDDVITSGGLIGRVTGISDRFLTIEISEKVRVRVLRSQVASKEGATAEKK